MKILILFLLLNCCVFAQNQTQKFTVTIHVDGNLEGKKIYLSYQYADCQEGTIIDSQYVSSNKVTFVGCICQPATAKIHRSIKLPSQIIDILPKDFLLEFTGGNLDDSYEFFLTSGKTTITANNLFSDWTISGPPPVLDFEVLKQARTSLDSTLSFLLQEILRCGRNGDKKCQETLIKEAESEKTKLRIVFSDYAMNHPESSLALYALKNSIPWNVDSPAVYLGNLSKLSDDIKNYPEAIVYKKLLEAAQNFHIGMYVENFNQLDSSGQIVSFNSFKSKFVLLYFWNSSSYENFNVHTDMLRLWENYQKSNFTIVSIGLESAQNKNRWLRILRTYRTPWIQLTDFKGLLNLAAKQFGVINLPFNLLIAPGGKIILRNGKIDEIDNILRTGLK